MSVDNNKALTQEAEDYVHMETGNRVLSGITGRFIIFLLIGWSFFQIWYASPLPYLFNFGVFNEDQARFIHLAFACCIGFCLFPFSQRSKNNFSFLDIFLGLISALSILYLLFFRDSLAQRMGLPTVADLVIAVVGMILLLEITRRTLGWPLVIVSIVFLTFTFSGQYMPDVISHKGASLNKVASHQWLTTEGVFGVALGVSTTFVFLFVLLGAFLDRAGAGNYLIKVSFSLLGHMRGGPAKAAVVASGLSGIISGSSIANVVTTGTFTIPLMKRVGFPGTKAGAIEVAASTNGQLTPPIMGAAAFLMVEYVGISYLEVIKHAILPSIISYIALVYIVHLEALKLKMKGIDKLVKPTLSQRMLVWVTNILILLALTVIVYYGSNFLEATLGSYAYIAMALLTILSYIWLVRIASKYPDLSSDDNKIELTHLPEPKPTVLSGLYFVIPIIVLLWALAVKQYSPQQSAFYGVMFLIFVVLTHRPLKAWFRGEIGLSKKFIGGYDDFVNGLINGARNMVGIGIATAAAGIIVGTVTLTGLGQMMTEFVEFISGGNLLLILFFTALICIILGMGLPTTANYIVVSTLMAPVIVSLGAENGLIVPLIAVHLFVFYFGILADDTPPVGLAAFAAAAISGDDPIKTGVQGFAYDIRTAILPFMFIFNTKLLLIGIDGVFDLLLTIFSSIIAILIFSTATQGFWLVKTKWWEVVSLLLLSFCMFRPDFIWDKIYPPAIIMSPSTLVKEVNSMKENDFINLTIEGENFEGENINKIVSLQLTSKEVDSQDKLKSLGILLNHEMQDNAWVIQDVIFGSAAERAGISFGWKITGIRQATERPPKELLFIPVLLILLIFYFIQKRRFSNEKRD